MTEPVASLPENPSPSIFRNRDFALFWASRICATLGYTSEGVALGWQVYAIARLDRDVQQSAFLVGMIGLVQFLPMLLLALPAGETADRYSRRGILLAVWVSKIFSAMSLIVVSLQEKPSLVALFVLAALFGVSRAFTMPASGAMAPMLVTRTQLPRAIAWSTIGFQTGAIIGPLLGGLLVAHSPVMAYSAAMLLYAAAGVALLLIRTNTTPAHNGGARLLLIREGLRYIRDNKLVLGAISLDLFAVLLGGATALLPVFARDILAVGPDGFGILRSAPAVGAVGMMLYLSRHPVSRRAGHKLLAAVAVFGLATIVFGLSKFLWLSVGALIVLGAADAISVYVRQSLVQIATPDAMRGRVSAVSGLFISASNELGEFESGVVARLLGPVMGAVFGGVGAIAVTGIWARLFPALRRADRLIEPDKT